MLASCKFLHMVAACKKALYWIDMSNGDVLARIKVPHCNSLILQHEPDLQWQMQQGKAQCACYSLYVNCSSSVRWYHMIDYKDQTLGAVNQVQTTLVHEYGKKTIENFPQDRQITDMQYFDGKLVFAIEGTIYVFDQKMLVATVAKLFMPYNLSRSRFRYVELQDNFYLIYTGLILENGTKIVHHNMLLASRFIGNNFPTSPSGRYIAIGYNYYQKDETIYDMAEDKNYNYGASSGVIVAYPQLELGSLLSMNHDSQIIVQRTNSTLYVHVSGADGYAMLHSALVAHTELGLIVWIRQARCAADNKKMQTITIF